MPYQLILNLGRRRGGEAARKGEGGRPMLDLVRTVLPAGAGRQTTDECETITTGGLVRHRRKERIKKGVTPRNSKE